MLTAEPQPGAEPQTGGRVSRLASRVARVGFLMTSRQMVVAVMSAVATAIVARVLGVSKFGQYAAAFGTVTMMLVLCDLGFSLVLSREMAMPEARRGRLLRTVLRAQTIWSSLVSFAMLLIAVGIGVTTTRGQILLILIPLVALSGLGAYRQIFAVTFDVAFLARVDIVSNLLTNGAMILVAVVLRSAVTVATAFAIGSLASALLVAWAGSRRLDPERASRQDVWPLVRRAFPFGVNSIITSAYFTIDLVLLQFLVGSHPLGEYAAACKFLSIMVTVPGLILSAALPALAMLHEDREGRSELTARLTHWLAVTALPVNIGLCVFAGPAVHIAFGRSYSASVPLLRILAGAGAVGCLLNPIGITTVALALNRRQMISNAVALTFNVAGNLLLVPLAGVTASAWLTLATDILAGVLLSLMVRNGINFRPVIATLGKPFVACAVMALVGVAGSSVPAVGVVAAGTAYVATLSLLGGWPEEVTRQWQKVIPSSVRSSA